MSLQKNKERIAVYLDSDLALELKLEAVRTGKSNSALVQSALTVYLNFGQKQNLEEVA